MNDHPAGEIPVILRVVGAAVHTKNDEASTLDARGRIIDFFHRHLS